MTGGVTLILTKDLISKYRSEGRIVKIGIKEAVKMLNQGFKGPVMVSGDGKHLYMCPRDRGFAIIYHCEINSGEEFEAVFRAIIKGILDRLGRVYDNVTAKLLYEALLKSGLLNLGVSWVDKRLLLKLKSYVTPPDRHPSGGSG